MARALRRTFGGVLCPASSRCSMGSPPASKKHRRKSSLGNSLLSAYSPFEAASESPDLATCVEQDISVFAVALVIRLAGRYILNYKNPKS